MPKKTWGEWWDNTLTKKMFVDPIVSGLTLPGDVWAGRVPMYGPDGRTSDEMVTRAGDLAGSVTLGAGAIPADANALRMGIKAYHGSPHDFDKFSMDKIGTGEGAQAYGHGLYFAENDAVAKEYRDKLTQYSGKVRVTTNHRDGIIDDSASTHERFVAARLRENKGDVQAATRQIEADAAAHPGDKTVKQALEFIKAPDAKFEIAEYNPGRMYEVDINASPDEFLDWDKPLGQQSKAVQDAVAKIDNPIVQAWKQNGAWPHVRGQSLYDVIAGGRTNAAVAAGETAKGTATLTGSGVKGIKYLDQGSRALLFDGKPITSTDYAAKAAADALELYGTPDAALEALGRSSGYKGTNAEAAQLIKSGRVAQSGATNNYVVFDDSLVSILKKYGVVGPVLTALGISQALPDRAQAQQ